MKPFHLSLHNHLMDYLSLPPQLRLVDFGFVSFGKMGFGLMVLDMVKLDTSGRMGF